MTSGASTDASSAAPLQPASDPQQPTADYTLDGWARANSRFRRGPRLRQRSKVAIVVKMERANRDFDWPF